MQTQVGKCINVIRPRFISKEIGSFGHDGKEKHEFQLPRQTDTKKIQSQSQKSDQKLGQAVTLANKF